MSQRFPEAAFVRPGFPGLIMPRRSGVKADGRRLLAAADGLRAELLDLAAAEPAIPAWRALAAQAIEPNPFFEPAFLVPAARHLGRSELRILTVRDEGSEALHLLVPVAARGGFRLSPVASAWSHNQFVLGTPLLAAGAAGPALALALAGLAATGAAALLLPYMPLDGPVAGLLQSLPAGQAQRVFDAHVRAVLDVAGRPQPGKEARRLLRRLAERGPVGFGHSTGTDAAHDALERFLALEAAGWKGGRGTALVQAAGRAAFVRTMARRFADEDRLHVLSLDHDGRMIAGALVITAGREAFYWKTAFDEGYARFSPGVRLSESLGGLFHGRSIGMIDSCAIPDHPMIDRLWAGRRRIGDILVPLRPGGGGFALASAEERARRGARAFAKRRYRGLLDLRLRLSRAAAGG